MVNYNKRKKTKPKARRDNYSCFEFNFDPYKILNNVIDDKRLITPNFDRMNSRPDNDGPLPLYMKNIHSRQASQVLNDKTLKLNNFSEGKFLHSISSFFPKKSYNKIINLNLLNSEKFKEHVGLKTKKGSYNLDGFSEYIRKSLKFYSKSYPC